MVRRSKCRCQVEGCSADLRLCQSYCLKRRICEVHLKADRLTRSGHKGWFRFCSQCGRLELTTKFDGSRRSCRESLLRRRTTAMLPGASCHRRHARRPHQHQQHQHQPMDCCAAAPSGCDSEDAAALLADAWCRFSEEQHSQEEQQQLAALEEALPDEMSAGSLDGPLLQLLQNWQQPDSPQAGSGLACEAHSGCCLPPPSSVPVLLDPAAAVPATIGFGCGCNCGLCNICLQAALADQLAAEMAAASAATATRPSWCPEPAQTSQMLQQQVARLMAGCPGPCVPMPLAQALPGVNYVERIGCIKEGLAILAEELAGLEACMQLTGECF